jgi:hypothetical protein
MFHNKLRQKNKNNDKKYIGITRNTITKYHEP